MSSESQYLKNNGAEVINFGAFSADNLESSFNYDPNFPSGKSIGEMMNWWIGCYVRGSNRRWFIENGDLILVIHSSDKVA